MTNNKIILYSHGFGVQKDDRGLFTDIAGFITDVEHVLFDYNQVDYENNILIVTPLHDQAAMLKKQYEYLRSENPKAEINLVCHSQGCVVAGLTKLKDVQKIILLAPPTRFLGSEKKLAQMSEREGTKIKDGVVSYPRRDGSTTIIKQDYWRSRDKITDPVGLYNELAQDSEVIIVDAMQDEVLGERDYSALSSNIAIINEEASHDFTEGARRRVLVLIKNLLS